MQMDWIDGLEPRHFFSAYAPDASFGGDGVLPPLLPGDTQTVYPRMALVRTDGHGILITRDTTVNGKQVKRLERYTAGGTLDPTFTPRNIPDSSGRGLSTFGDRQGRLLLIANPTGGSVSVTRYNADGTLDRSFGTDGTAVTPTVTLSDYAASLAEPTAAVTADGTIYLSAYASFGNSDGEYDHSQSFLFKLDPTGRPVSRFGTRGVLALDTRDKDDTFFLAVDPQNRLVVGQSNFFDNRFTFSRFTPAGRVDRTFAKRGRFIDLYAEDRFATYKPLIDTQGRLLLVRTNSALDLQADDRESVDVLRLTTAGQPDPTFGHGGTETDVYGSRDTVVVQSALLQSDDKLVLQVRQKSFYGNYRYFIRLDEHGRHDTGFDGDGVATVIPIANGAIADAIPIAALPDGSFLAEAVVELANQSNATTLEKIAPLVPARLGASGTLYLTDDGGNDRVTVSRTDKGVTRVVFNKKTYDFVARVTGITANLGQGDNAFDAPLNVPQRVRTGDGQDTVTTGDGDDIVNTAGGNDTIRTNGGAADIRFDGGAKQISAGPGGGKIVGGGTRAATGDAGALGHIGVVTATGDDARPDNWNIDLRGTRVNVIVGGRSAVVQVQASVSAAVDATAVLSAVSATMNGRRAVFSTRRATARVNAVTIAGSTLTGGLGDDILRASGGFTRIDGRGGNDLIVGTAADDYLRGGAGDDRLYGEAGRDDLRGEAGRDTLSGGPGDDVLMGGDRYLNNPASRNRLDGGPGDDSARRESDDDVLTAIELA